ncbi:MAG: DUF4382 domain-containing protein [Bacteroidia bacterium]|jgi:hypothetical protein|nr:DUF4382 domain-containing protein [Bacteroidia bacterium]
MRNHNFIRTIFFAALLVFFSCRKGNDTGHFQTRLMDAPFTGNVQQVNVEITGAEAHIDGAGWVSLPVQSGVYNLLDFVNGIDTLFINTDIPAGKLSQFRLLLGTQNSIMVDSMQHPLQIPSGSQSGLKINVNEQINDAATTVLFLDFDAGRSIKQNGNGDYELRPVMRGFNATQTGAITGNYTAAGKGVMIEAQCGNQFYTTYAHRQTGHFMLRGLPAGSYTVRIYLADVAAPVSVSVVNVAVNTLVDLGAL